MKQILIYFLLLVGLNCFAQTDTSVRHPFGINPSTRTNQLNGNVWIMNTPALSDNSLRAAHTKWVRDYIASIGLTGDPLLDSMKGIGMTNRISVFKIATTTGGGSQYTLDERFKYVASDIATHLPSEVGSTGWVNFTSVGVYNSAYTSGANGLASTSSSATDAGYYIASNAPATNDQESGIVVTDVSGYGRFIVKYIDAGNYLYVEPTSSSVTIKQVIGYATTTIATTATGYSSGDTVQVRTNASAVYAKKNGTVLITNTFNNTTLNGTRVGFYSYNTTGFKFKAVYTKDLTISGSVTTYKWGANYDSLINKPNLYDSTLMSSSKRLKDTAAAIRAAIGTGGGITALTGDLAASGTGSVAATIGSHAVTFAKQQQIAGLSIPGVTGNSTADMAAITFGTDKFGLFREGNTLVPKLADSSNLAAGHHTENYFNTKFAPISVTGLPAGSTNQIQYYNSGVFGASSDYTWNNSTKKLDAKGTIDFGTNANGSRLTLYNQDDATYGFAANAGARLYPSSATTNVATSLALMPKGTGASATYKTAFGLWNGDFVAAPTNSEFFIMSANGDKYVVGSYHLGSGTTWPIILDATNVTDHSNPVGARQLVIATNGMIGINNTSPSAYLHTRDSTVDGTIAFRSENVLASGTYKSGSLTQMGSTAYGITDWVNAFVIEGQADGGTVYSAYDGDHKWTSGHSRTQKMKLTNAGVLSVVGLGSGNEINLDTTNYKLTVTDGSGNLKRMKWQVPTGGGGSGISGLTGTRIPFATSSTTIGDDANLYWDNTNKRLSIGAGSSPAYKLDISENTNGIIGFQITNPNSGTAAQVQNKIVNDAGSLMYNGIGSSTHTGFVPADNKAFVGSYQVPFSIFTQSADDIIFYTNATERMRIGSTGTVNVTGLSGTGNRIGVLNSSGDLTRSSYDPALFAPLASPTFTGTPAGPTAAQFTNTTQFATAAFTQQELMFRNYAASGDANYTVANLIYFVELTNPITTNRTLTLPTPASNTGRELKVLNRNSSGSTWSIAANAVTATGSSITTLTNQTWYIFYCDGTNWVKQN